MKYSLGQREPISSLFYHIWLMDCVSPRLQTSWVISVSDVMCHKHMLLHPLAVFYIKSTDSCELPDNKLSSCLLLKKTGEWLRARKRMKERRGGRLLKKRPERNPFSFSFSLSSSFMWQEKKKRRLGSALKALKKPRSPPGQICEMRKWLKGQEAGGR